MPDTDSREPHAMPGEIRSTRDKAAAALTTRTQGLQVDFDEITGGPKHIMATGRFLTEAAGPLDESTGLDRLKHIVSSYVDANRDLFGHDSSAIRDDRSRISRNDVSAHNGLHTVVWQQELDGIPFFQVLLRASVTRNGEVVTMGGNFLGDPEGATGLTPSERSELIAHPPLPAERAIALAAADIDTEVEEQMVKAAGAASGAEQRRDYQAPGLSDTRAGLSWVATGHASASLAWDVTLMGTEIGEMYRVLVDARTGDVLVRHGLTNYISNATYRVYAKNSNLQPHDSPTPMSPGHATPLTTQPPEVARELITLPALNTTASPDGWISDGGTQTLGNNVDAHTDTDANNSPDLPRPTSATRTFDFPIDFTAAPSGYKEAAVTQLFYMNNWVHDRLYELGFTESSGNFQTNNFGRGGIGNDAVQADAQDGSGTNNANFSTPADGSPGRMQMYVFTGPTPDIDGDLDAEIVIHEYCHGLSNRLVGGGSGISALQTRSMGEGWSDFYGLALLSEPGDDIHANYATGGYATRQFSSLTQNYYFGIRRYPYSTNLLTNPLTFKDIDPNQASTHSGIARSPIIGTTANEVHNAGEVWCAALWDMRANLITKLGYQTGNTQSLQLTTDGMKLSPVNPNFLQARDAILQADFVNNAGANRSEIWAAFAKRGMGATATSPASNVTTGLVENFDLPDSLDVGPNTLWSVTGTVGGQFDSTQAYTLINNSSAELDWTAAKTQPWLNLSATSGKLAAGASATITASFHSTARSLAAGNYSDTITFTNATSGIYQQRAVSLVIEPLTQLIARETWEAGSPGGAWSITGTSTHRTLVTTANAPHGGAYHLTMDSSMDGTYARNEATWTVNLAGRSNVQLRFWLKMFNDEANGPPTTPFTTGADFDGVAISADGTNWYEVTPLRTLVSTWTRYTVDLDAALATHGLAYGPNFKIRFNHYDNYAITTDGFAFDDIELVETIQNRLTLSLPDGVNEGAATANVNLTAIPAPTSDLTVSLTSSNPAEATPPASVTIPAGQDNITIPVTIADDSRLDGTQSVTLAASAAGYGSGANTLLVHDNETAALSLGIPSSTTEGVPDVTGLVSIDQIPDADINVELACDSPVDLQVPSTATILAGQTSAVIHLTPVDDDRIDGSVTATVTARVTNWPDCIAAISVADNETNTLSLTLPASTREGDGSFTGSVRIPGTLPAALTIALASSNDSEITLPASVTIPEGKSVASFTATVVDDAQPDGARQVTLTATAAGFTEAAQVVNVRDNDAHHFTFAPLDGSRIPNAPFSVSIEARDVNDAVITNYNSAVSLSAAGSSGAIGVTPVSLSGWSSGIWSSNVTLASSGANVTLTANDGQGHTGTSDAFDVSVGPIDHFEWSAVSSPNTRDQFFPVTITAKDAGNNVADSFTGTAALKALPDAQAITEVGTGTGTLSYPMHTGFDDARSQVIYLAGELGGAGSISGLALNVTSLPGQVMNAWTIRIKPTTLASYTGSAQWESTGWTTVYQANQTISSTGWQTFMFPVPFVYDGTSNLLIDFSHNNSTYTSNGYVMSSTASTSRMAYYSTDSGYGDPLTWTGTTPIASITTSIPNLRIIRQGSGAGVPIHPVATGNFVNGVWTGLVAVPFTGQGVKLLAKDGARHTGTSNSFIVSDPPPPPSGSSVVLNEPFESTALGSHWTITGTSTYRTQLNTANTPHGGTRHLTMDSTTDGSYARNEATLTLDLSGRGGVSLSFWAKSFSDEANGPPPSPFTGGYDFDGVAISADGSNWYEVQGLRALSSTYTQFTVDLDAAIAARGLSYTPAFKIRFNQYDNYMISTDGIAIDDILITANSLPSVTVALPAQALETSGILSGTVTLPMIASTDTSVTLSSNANARLTVPPNVTIPAGQSSANFEATLVDNTLLDGNRSVAVTASAGGSSVGSASILIIDDDVSTLTLSTPPSVTEGTTNITATASLTNTPAAAITFNVSSSDTSEITVPSTITIPVGQTSVNFPLTIVNDTLIDGTQNAVITISASGWTSASQTVAVQDNESTALTLTLPSSVNEGGIGAGAVSIAGTMTTPLVVNMISDAGSRLGFPTTITIPAGVSSVSFTLTGVEDTVANDPLSATLTVSAGGFTSASRSLTLIDNDPHHFAISPITSPKNSGVAFSITITAQDSANATLAAYSGTASLSASGDAGGVSITPAITGAFTSGVWSGAVTCQSSATNVRITASAGSATGVSNPFDLSSPPVISLNPASINLTLDQGASTTRSVTISNNGAGGSNPLVWSSSLPTPWVNAVQGPETEPTPPATESAAQLPLESVLANLNLKYALVNSAVPNRYAFSEGITGTSITDGSGDMYDGGNYLSTNLGTYLSYSDNLIAASTLLGNGGRYFTRKYDGLWAFAADVSSLTYFEITGNLGADGSGTTDSTILTTQRNGITYRGFVKRVYNAGDPSVNHLIIVPDGPGVTHEPSTNTDYDNHRLSNLPGVTRIYYLLYAGTGGAFINNISTLAIMNAFLDAAGVSSFVTASPASGSINAGSQQTLTLTIDSTGLDKGLHAENLVISSNDPATPQATLPIQLTVMVPSNLTVTPDTGLAASGPRRGPFTPTTKEFTLTNSGSHPMDWTASMSGSWIQLSATSGTLSGGASTTITATLDASAANLPSGTHTGTLTFTNLTNNSGTTTRSVTLTATPFGELAVSDNQGMAAAGYYGGPFSPSQKTQTLTNTGDAPLDWTATADTSWLSLSSTGGALAPGASVNLITSINAPTTPPGSRQGTVTLANTTNGIGGTVISHSLGVALPPPSILSEPPVTGGTDNTLGWSAVPGANRYEVQACTDSGFTVPLTSGAVTGNSHVFTGLGNNLLYFFRARARYHETGTLAAWSQSSQAEFDSGVRNNVSTSTVPGSVVLATGGLNAFENFDAPGTAWSNTMFPNTSTGTFIRSALSGTGPSTTPALPVNQGGDFEASLLGTRPSALMLNSTSNNFTNGSIEAWIAPGARSSLHYSGLLLRANRTTALNGYAALLVFFPDGTAKADFSRIIAGSDNGTSNWFYTNTTAFTISSSENVHAIFSISGSTLTLRLWRVAIAGGVVTETPIPFYQGGNTLTASDTTYTAAGLAGLYDSYSSVYPSLFDDVTVKSTDGGAYAGSGTYLSPLISPSPFHNWRTLNLTKNNASYGTSISVDVLDANNNLLAADLSNGTDLNAIPAVASQTAIRLRANLATTIYSNTPRLDDWSVSWQATPDTEVLSQWSSTTSSLQDAAPPVVSVSTPRVIDVSSVSITGTASDLVAVTSVTVNGVSTSTPDGFLHWQAPPVELNPGWNSFTIAASDMATPPNVSLVPHNIYRITDGSDADNDGLPDAWEDLHGLDLFSSSGTSGAHGDRDGDGICNLLELAFGMDPGTPDVENAPQVSAELNPADGLTYLTLRHRRLIQPGGVSYQIEVSGDCSNWTTDTARTEQVGTPTAADDGLTETVTMRIKPAMQSAGHPRTYVRVRIKAD